MTEPVNLNRFRKARARAEAAAKAAENRVLHGRTAAERARDNRAAETAKRTLDGAELDGAGREEPTGG